jgi:hypothetical protein
MPAERQPPVPRAAQRMMWLARAVSTVGLAIGIYFAIVSMADGHAAQALLVLAIAVCYTLSTWVDPLSPLFWVTLGCLSGLFLFVDPGLVSLTLAVALVILFWMRSRIQPPSVSSLTPIFTDDVMPGAAAYVAELTDLGWRQVGGYTFDSARTPVTATVLLHPDGDRYAAITDMVFGIESRYPDSKILLTINSSRASLPPAYLTNVRRGSPAKLADSHQRAIDVLESYGLTPLPLDPEAVVEEALASEVETIEWNARRHGFGLFNFGGGAGELDDSSVSAQRIEMWIAAPVSNST